MAQTRDRAGGPGAGSDLENGVALLSFNLMKKKAGFPLTVSGALLQTGKLSPPFPYQVGPSSGHCLWNTTGSTFLIQRSTHGKSKGHESSLLGATLSTSKFWRGLGNFQRFQSSNAWVTSLLSDKSKKSEKDMYSRLWLHG